MLLHSLEFRFQPKPAWWSCGVVGQMPPQWVSPRGVVAGLWQLFRGAGNDLFYTRQVRRQFLTTRMLLGLFERQLSASTSALLTPSLITNENPVLITNFFFHFLAD
jgi:hypothetical protein